MTESELLEALESALGQPADADDAYTLSELEDATGKGRNWLHTRLRLALKAGTVQAVMAQKTDAWGVTHPRAAYRFKRAA